MTPVVTVHGAGDAEPFSKPGLPRSCVEPVELLTVTVRVAEVPTRPVPYVDVANVTPEVDVFETPVFQTWPLAAPLSVMVVEPKSPRPRPEDGTPNVPVQTIGDVVSLV